MAYFNLPSGDTNDRPSSPSYGATRYNTTTGAGEIYTSAGWGVFGSAPGTIGNPLASVAAAQSEGLAEGLWYFKNSSGTAQQLYYDPSDSGWILVASNNASDTTIPGGTSRNDLNYTLIRNGTNGALGTASPNSDYIIGNWLANFSFSRARVVGFGRGSTNGTYSWTNRGTYLIAQFATTSRTQVVGVGSVSVTGTSSLYSASNYWSLDSIQVDYNNGGFTSNSNQSTLGIAAVNGSSGDPTTGCYFGHGSSEGSFEGWYDSGGGAADCQGYTSWVR